MTRLPQPGSDAGQWGDILNEFLTQAHNTDGTLKDDSVASAQLAPNSVQGSAIADGSVTAAKLDPGIIIGGTIADNSITTIKLVDNAVTNAKVDAATRASLSKADSASQPGHPHAIADVTNLQTTLDGKQAVGSYVPTSRKVAGHDLTADITITTSDIGAATSAQGAKADTAVQPGSLATVATTGVYNDLTSKPTLGGAASLNVGTTAGTVAAGDDTRIAASVPSTRTVAGHALSSNVTITPADISAATSAQGAKADTAVQPGSLATVATTGAYNDLTGKPTLGGAASLSVGTTAGTVAAGDDTRITTAVPTTRTVAGHPLGSDVTITPADIGAATTAQGTLAGTALQPGQANTANRRVTGAHVMIVASRSFMGILLPPETSREMLIIRNVGVNPIEAVISSTASTNYNGAAWTGSTMIQPGEEWVGTTAGQPQIAPTADAIEIRALIWTEAYI